MKIMHIFLFLVSFAVGCIFVYLSPTEHKTVIVYPTPKNVKKIQYMDNANNCFKFNAKLVNCKKEARKIPVQ